MFEKILKSESLLLIAICWAIVSIPSFANDGKEPTTLKLKLIDTVQVKDISSSKGAVLSEDSIVLAGSKGFTEEEFMARSFDPDKLDPNVVILDLKKKTQTAFTNGHKAPIQCLAFDGNRIFTTSNSRDPYVRTWDLKAKKKLAEIEIAIAPSEGIHRYGVACFPKSKRLAISLNDKLIVLDPNKPKERTEFVFTDKWVGWLDQVLDISPDETRIACVGGKCHIVLWDVKSKTSTAIAINGEPLKLDEQWMSDGVVFGPKNELLAWRTESSGEVPNGVKEKDIPIARRGVVQIELPQGKVAPLGFGHTIRTHIAAFDPSGEWLATGGFANRDKPIADNMSSGEIRVYHRKTGKLVFREQCDDYPITWVAFTPSGKRIIASTDKGTVHWWDLQE